MNDHAKQLIEGRPKVYGRLGFQQTLLWVFIALGIIFFFTAIFNLVWGLIESALISEISKELANYLNAPSKTKLIEKLLVKYFAPLELSIIRKTFYLCLASFVLARYCQKVINRNRYIMALENAINR